MAGNLVPLVMVPRYTAYAGATEFTTIGMDVTAYERSILNVWMAPLVGETTPAPTLAIAFEESTDQVVWSACDTSPSPSGTPPAANTEIQYVSTLKKRWFRVKITLGGGNPVATCWVVGFLEERES